MLAPMPDCASLSAVSLTSNRKSWEVLSLSLYLFLRLSSDEMSEERGLEYRVEHPLSEHPAHHAQDFVIVAHKRFHSAKTNNDERSYELQVCFVLKKYCLFQAARDFWAFARIFLLVENLPGTFMTTTVSARNRDGLCRQVRGDEDSRYNGNRTKLFS